MEPIRGFQTNEGVKKYDYDALQNKPDLTKFVSSEPQTFSLSEQQQIRENIGITNLGQSQEVGILIVNADSDGNVDTTAEAIYNYIQQNGTVILKNNEELYNFLSYDESTQTAFFLGSNLNEWKSCCVDNNSKLTQSYINLVTEEQLEEEISSFVTEEQLQEKMDPLAQKEEVEKQLEEKISVPQLSGTDVGKALVVQKIEDGKVFWSTKTFLTNIKEILFIDLTGTYGIYGYGSDYIIEYIKNSGMVIVKLDNTWFNLINFEEPRGQTSKVTFLGISNEIDPTNPLQTIRVFREISITGFQWSEEKLAPVPVDSTLENEGWAADARVTGIRLDQLENSNFVYYSDNNDYDDGEEATASIDADTLGGKLPSEFATKNDLDTKAPVGYVSRSYESSDNDTIDRIVQKAHSEMADNSISFITINVTSAGLNLNVGVWTIKIIRNNLNYGTIEAVCCDQYRDKSLVSGVWGPWVSHQQAIKAAPAGFGLGGANVYTPNGNWDNTTENGWYSGTGNSPTGYAVHGFVIKYTDDYIIQQVYSLGSGVGVGAECARRIKNKEGWQPWEWVNPPMLLGIEYRTAERWKGKAVYTKIVSLGTVGAGENTISLGIPGITAMCGLELTDSNNFCVTGHPNILSAWATPSAVVVNAQWEQTLYATLKYTKD